MKTALMTASYLDGIDPLGSDRLERLRRFVDWHCNYWVDPTDLFLSDNASSEFQVKLLRRTSPEINIMRHVNHLLRAPGDHGYIYCWRFLYDVKILMQLGYQKIVFLDSDCFIVSQRMVDYIDSIKSGWEAFWIPKYEFPSAECYVLCEDAFPLFRAFTAIPYQDHCGKLMETALPFTKINKTMKVDRWGETRTPHKPYMDMYSQCPTDLYLEFTK